MEIYFYDLHKFEVIKLLLFYTCGLSLSLSFFVCDTFNVASGKHEEGVVCLVYFMEGG